MSRYLKFIVSPQKSLLQASTSLECIIDFYNFEGLIQLSAKLKVFFLFCVEIKWSRFLFLGLCIKIETRSKKV
ncbi:hypothetical protein DW155_05105 [Lactococcus petauri]|nr:hypothetical protein DW155_05105 [Lactococcus petauri]